MFFNSLQRMRNQHHLRGSIIRLFLLLAIISAFFSSSRAHAATQGVAEPPDNVNDVDGSTSATAYHIATLGNLVWLHDEAAADRTEGRFYLMTQNIDVSDTANWNDVGTSSNRLEGFAPIGDVSHPFGGVFDGGGYTITGLRINRPSLDYVGLFGRALQGPISNLALEGVNITGNNCVGGIAGLGHVLSRCSVKGTVISVNTTDQMGLTGGVAGWCTAITDSYAVANVVGYDNTGGLAGECPGGPVTNCYFEGSVSGNSNVGGLIGNGDSSFDNARGISNCHVNCTVTATGFYVGGLVGFRASIENCFSVGNVTGRGVVGGLIGEQSNNGTISNSYASGNVVANGGYYGTGAGGLVGSISNASIQNCHVDCNVLGAGRLGGLAGDSSGSIIKQCSASGTIAGMDSDASFIGGLIGHAAYDSLEDCRSTIDVAGKMFVGGLLGQNEFGTIVRCVATGDVTANDSAGGLIAVNSGNIANSYATGTVDATPVDPYQPIGAGGLIGSNSASVQNCYATGATTLRLEPQGGNLPTLLAVAGLIGSNSGSATIRNCYANGPVVLIHRTLPGLTGTGDTHVGGLTAAVSDDTSVLDSFWDIQTTGQAASAAGLGLTTLQMRQQTTFTNWDFATLWRQQGSYPYLQAFTSCTLTCVAGPHGVIGLDNVGLPEVRQVLNLNARIMPVWAEGDANYLFKEWSDFTTSNPCTMANLTTNTILTARFARPASPRVGCIGIYLTTNLQPGWWWQSGGGVHVYRYQLDGEANSGWTVTLASTWTAPQALSYGWHTLYVQEADLLGNWSNSGHADVHIVSVTGAQHWSAYE